jgi:hypothetical protein
MPGVDNPAGIDASIAGQVKELLRLYKDLSANKTFSPAAFHIGLGGLIVDGPTTLTSPLTFSGTISGPVTIGDNFAAVDITASNNVFGIGGIFSGGVSVANNITSATGTVSGVNGTYSGQVYSAAALRSPGSRSYVVSTSYAGGWIDGDGTIGISPSSRRYKENIVPADLVELATKLRACVPVWFTYKTAMFDAQNVEKAAIQAAIEAAAADSKIDDASLVDVRPLPVDIVPLPVVNPVISSQQLGFIAEDLEAAGLGVLCFYDADGLVEGINYDRLSIVLAAAAILDHQEILGLQDRVQMLEAQRGQLETDYGELRDRLDKAGL